MPCIQWKTSAAISAEQEKELREALGEAIALIPGKSESWLMLEFEPERRMAFRGDAQEPTAFVCVDLYGKAPAAACDALTTKICSLAQSVTGVKPDHVYVRYLMTDTWGWNGSNF